MGKQLEFEFTPTDRQAGYLDALRDLREWISVNYDEGDPGASTANEIIEHIQDLEADGGGGR